MHSRIDLIQAVRALALDPDLAAPLRRGEDHSSSEPGAQGEEGVQYYQYLEPLATEE